MGKRVGLAVILISGFLTGWFIMELATCGTAKAEGFRVIVTKQPPTVAGQRRDASGQRYRPQGATVRFRPVARAYELEAPAPRGRCGRLFEVVSGPPAQRGCYGWN